jgi:hypothetical protein
MFMISVPFFLLFFSSPDNWWALLPAGSTASVGLMILLEGVGGPLLSGSVPPGFMFLGLAATFWVLWLRRRSSGTDWAKYPAIGLAISGILMIGLGGGMGYFWPVLLILGGIAILFLGFRSRKVSNRFVRWFMVDLRQPGFQSLPGPGRVFQVQVMTVWKDIHLAVGRKGSEFSRYPAAFAHTFQV